MATEVEGDLLEFPCDFAVHQVNCVTKHARGLADKIFAKWPVCDIYKLRQDPLMNQHFQLTTPGELAFTDTNSEKGPKTIVHLFGQRQPGLPDSIETKALRLHWFSQALGRFVLQENQTVAFPGYIGCDLAGGDWSIYKSIIDDFAEAHPNRVTIVYLKRREESDHKRRKMANFEAFRNCTQHAVTLETDTLTHTWQPYLESPPLLKEHDEVQPDYEGVPIISKTFGEIEGLPEPEPGIVLIVPLLVAQAAKDRYDLVSPDSGKTALRTEGQIRAVRRFVYPHKESLAHKPNQMEEVD